MLSAITTRDQSFNEQLAPPVVFEGNRPCRWTGPLADASGRGDGSAGFRGLLGESVEIGPPLSLELSRDTGRNVLVITPAGVARRDPGIDRRGICEAATWIGGDLFGRNSRRRCGIHRAVAGRCGNPDQVGEAEGL